MPYAAARSCASELIEKPRHINDLTAAWLLNFRNLIRDSVRGGANRLAGRNHSWSRHPVWGWWSAVGPKLWRRIAGGVQGAHQAHQQARRTCTATSPNSISGPTPAISPTRSVPTRYWLGRKASGFSIDSLTKPRTPKQLTRAFQRWRDIGGGVQNKFTPPRA